MTERTNDLLVRLNTLTGDIQMVGMVLAEGGEPAEFARLLRAVARAFDDLADDAEGFDRQTVRQGPRQ